MPLHTGEREYHQLIEEWNNTTREYPQIHLLHRLIEQQVEKTPGAKAVIFEERTLTYQELNSRANQVAHALQKRGVGPDTLVGVVMERSLELVIALLGILKAGGAYVPLDPSYPGERLAFMLEDTQVPVVLTQAHLQERLPAHTAQVIRLDSEWEQLAHEATSNPMSELTPEHLAYVIYTSGSTGTPKGAMNTHRGICNRLLWMQEAYQLNETDRVLQKTPYSFDVSVWEFFWPLMTGARLVVARPEGHKDSSYLLSLIQQEQITTLHFVPSMLQLIVEEPELQRCSSLRRVICSGEALPFELQQRFFARHATAELHNLYGPTEAAVDVTYWPCQRQSELRIVPIGYPIANIQLYILDEQGKSVAMGEAGELHIGGVGLARGYLNRPELTRQKFIAHPFRPGERLYRTGDLARYLPDGAIEYLGRLDDQVKLRGFRIELGEIEAVLRRHPAVREAVVILREDTPGDKRLVAYLVLHKEQTTSTPELQQHVLATLPDYMLPSTFVLLEALPLSPNGKVARKALPVPEAVRPAIDVEFVAPRTALEKELSSIWSQVLGMQGIGIHDNFFALGGHSLLASQVLLQLRTALHVELSLRRFFEAPTIAGLAANIEQLDVSSRSVQSELTPLSREQYRKDTITGEVVFPASSGQQGLWFLSQLEPGSTAYNISSVMHLDFLIREDVLRQSLLMLIQRHEALRTTFEQIQGELMQVIAPARELSLTTKDLRHLPQEQASAEMLRLATEEAQCPFDLARGPLWRVLALTVTDEESLLVLTIHHIIFDGWSNGIFFQELAELYQCLSTEQTISLPALAVQPADIAAWQRQWLNEARLAEHLSYWKRQLDGAPPVLELPTDRLRPAVPTSCGFTHLCILPQELSAELKMLSRRENVSLYITLVAAFQTLLSRYTGQKDIVIGTAIANRSLPDVQGIIGYFLNTVVLRTQLTDDLTFQQLLSRVRDITLEAHEHQDMPFDYLVQQLRPAQSAGLHPLFQVLLTFDPPFPELPSGWDLRQMEISTGSARLDLYLEMADRPEGLVCRFEYSSDLFDEVTIARMAGHWQTLLAAVVQSPEGSLVTLPLLTEAERRQLLVKWNDTAAEYPRHACLHRLFEAQVERTPEKVAVIFGTQSLTYRELNQQANQLAHYLRKLGVEPETRVGLYLERSLDMLVALLGILKAGGAYLPMDPTYPADRLSFMLEDAQVPVLVTQQSLSVRLSTKNIQVVCLDSMQDALRQQSMANLPEGASSDNLAYVIYTSGSTGRPKGVQIPHAAVVNFLYSMREQPGLKAEDILLAVTSISFDIAGLELFLPLITGAQIVLAASDVTINGEALIELLHGSKATVMQATPATWRMLLAAGWQGKPDLKVLCGGEALPLELAQQLLPKVGLLWNMYGPTETTIWSTTCEITTNCTTISVGRPIANTQIYILDTHLQPVPVGVPGELYIGGDGLARGYLNRPELTQERFIADPFSSSVDARLYRTGDLARYCEDGSIEVIGRLDHQVKVRGYRIELGEIESVLSQHEGIRQAVVIVREDVPGDKRLVAYLVQEHEQRATVDELQSYVSTRLPAYMVPASFVWLETLPLTPNGKIDRRALPEPDATQTQTREAFVAPRTPLEEMVAAAWGQILGLERVGIHDDFFALGGHSLLATQVIAQLRASLQVELSLRSFFDAPTVARLAEYISQQQAQKPSRSKPALRARSREAYRATSSQP